MDKIDYISAIKARHSVRAYLSDPIDDYQAEVLRQAIKAANANGNLNFQLVLDEPRAFGDSRLAHYGKFSNVRNYICIVADKSHEAEVEAGYYGEEIVLIAQALGLNTCWVALTFKKGAVKVEIGENQKLYALISIGRGANQGFNHKIKRPDQVANAEGLEHEWFAKGVEMALLAPTAINQQKFRFELQPDGRVAATRSWGPYSRMDLGIAKRHFEIGASPRQVEWK